MKETHQDVLDLIKDDTPENRQAFEEKYGSFAVKVLTTTLIESVDVSSRFKKTDRTQLVTIIDSYDDPTVIEPMVRAFKLLAASDVSLMRAISKYDHKTATKFLHAFISIRSRCKRLKVFFPSITQQVWDIYHAETRDHFNQQVDDLRTWAQQYLTHSALQSVLKLCDKSPLFSLAFQYPDAHRTSNMLDRHMELMDRYLYSTRYFHGHLMTAEYQLRTWALFHNSQPYCPRSKISDKYLSPFHKLNGFVYHDNWLHNLLVASSLAGRYATNTKQ